MKQMRLSALAVKPILSSTLVDKEQILLEAAEASTTSRRTKEARDLVGEANETDAVISACGQTNIVSNSCGLGKKIFLRRPKRQQQRRPTKEAKALGRGATQTKRNRRSSFGS